MRLSGFDEEETNAGANYVVDNIIENVWALQKSISQNFKNRGSLSTLVNALEKNDIDPLIGDRLLFKVALAKRKYDVPNTVSGTSASIPLTIGVYGVWFTPVVRKFASAFV